MFPLIKPFSELHLNNEIGDDGLHKISETLNVNATLVELDMSSNILNILYVPSKYLSGNDIGPDGVVYISEGLKSNSRLRVLCLSCKKTVQKYSVIF